MSSSSIGTYVISGPKGPRGPIGATGNTGETGNIGPLGPTGNRGVYVVSATNISSGLVLNLSDGNTLGVAGYFKGDTANFYISGATMAIYARGIVSGGALENYDTISSLIKSYDSSTGILQIKGLSAIGSLYLTEDDDAIYFHSTLADTGSELDIANLNADTLVYLKNPYQISSTAVGVSYDGTNYFGTLDYTNAKLNASARIKYVQPVERTASPIYLNVDDAGLFYLNTPIGIAGITGTLRKNEMVSITIIPESDDIWHFPSNVYFEAGENYFTCGKSVVNLTTTDQGQNWLATVVARGFDVDTGECRLSGGFGSCCYTDETGKLNCSDYVTKSLCDTVNGTFNPLSPCSIACGQGITGFCCSNGKCLDDSDPSECAAFGGVFYAGFTCGAFANNPNGKNFEDRLCPNNCQNDEEILVSCCKNGECLGENFTKLLCEKVLGGVAYQGNCEFADCCEDNIGLGACCKDSTTCEFISKKACDEALGVWMGEDKTCEQVNCACIGTLELGACCKPDGSCAYISRNECATACGVFLGGPCTNNKCLGACCVNGVCSQKTRFACQISGGIFVGGGCNDNSCVSVEEFDGACCTTCSCYQATEDGCTEQGTVFNLDKDCSYCNGEGSGGDCATIGELGKCDPNSSMSGNYFLPFNVTKRLQVFDGTDISAKYNYSSDQISNFYEDSASGNFRFNDGILSEGVVPTYLINSATSEHLFFRTGQPVKDLLLPVEDFYGLIQNDSQINSKKVPSCRDAEFSPNQADEYQTTNPIYRDCSVINSRICFNIDMKAEGLSLDSFRIYLLRTGYPKNYSVNYCAYRQLPQYINGSASSNPYPFLNESEDESSYYGTDNIIYSYQEVPGSASISYPVIPSTTTLNGYLNYPLFGGAYTQFAPGFNNVGYSFDIDRIGKSYNVDEYQNQMFRPDPKMHFMGDIIPSSDSTFIPSVNKNSMGSFSSGNGYLNFYNRDGINTYGRMGVGIDHIHSLTYINPIGTGTLYKCNLNINGTFQQNLTLNYPLFLNSAKYNRIFNYGTDKHRDISGIFKFRNNYSYFPFRYLSIFSDIRRFFDLYYYGLTSDVYTYFPNSLATVPNYFSIIKTYSFNNNNTAIQNRDLPSGLPLGYFNLGYSIIETLASSSSNPSESITNKDYHEVPGITRDAKNSYYKRLSHISQRFSNKFKILNDNTSVKNYLVNYYPEISDIAGSGIQVNPGHPLLSVIPYGNDYGPPQIDSVNYLPHKDVIPTRPDTIIFDSGAIYYDKSTDTHKFLSDDLNQTGDYSMTPNSPFTVSGTTTKTKQYISKAISNPLYFRDGRTNVYPKGVVKYKGNGVYTFCITIPDILDYVADGGPFENGLRLVVYTDVMATDNQFTQKADVSLSNFGLDFGKQGSGCNFESVNVSDPTDLNCFDCSAGGVFSGCYLVAFRSKGGDCSSIFSSSTAGGGGGDITQSGGNPEQQSQCAEVCRTPDDFYSAFIMCDSTDSGDTDCQCKVTGLDMFSNQDCDALVVNNSWSFKSIQPPISARADKFASQQFFRNDPNGTSEARGERDPHNRGFRFGLDGIAGNEFFCSNDGYPPYRWWTEGLTSEFGLDDNLALGGLTASLAYAERVLPSMPEGTTYDPYTHAFIIPLLEDIDYSGIFNLGEILNVIGNTDKIKGIIEPTEGETCPAKSGINSSSYDCNHACIGGPYFQNSNFNLLNPYATFGSNYQKMSCTGILQDPYRYLAISDLYTVLTGQTNFEVSCSADFSQTTYPREGLFGQVGGIFELPTGTDIKYIKSKQLDEPCGSQLVGLRKLYVDDTNYICVEMDISDPIIRNNFETCGNEEA